MSTAPIGILGGTFDPIHYGHLRLAEELGERLRLEEVRFVPSGTPPHRSAPAVTADHRLAMTRLAAADNARFSVDERELRRAGPGYTFDTLKELRSNLGDARPLALLLGADLVELAPIPGLHGCDYTAAALAYKILSYVLMRRAH